VGLHLGPTVAGVIGVKRFIYDVWGDTVNVASRMESLGVPGRVHVTEAAARRLEGSFLLEPRGELEVKGKGPMRTWFLVGRRQAAAEVSAARVSRTAAVEADQA
jgi:adenylate cyclase